METTEVLSNNHIARPNRVKEWLSAHSYLQPKLTDNYQVDLRKVHEWSQELALSSPEESKAAYEYFQAHFPDEQNVDNAWNNPTNEDFLNFFTWGHNHNFGNGFKRDGLMGDRHIEIIAHAINLGMLPTNLSGQALLNVGCWTGGDAMLLSHMGARVHCIEEHQQSSACARTLFDWHQKTISVENTSIYSCGEDKRQAYDVIYCSGVIYHVTDPILLLRTLYAMLKPEGRLFIETKSSAPGPYAICSYSGGFERGWNWFAPNELAMYRMLADVGFDIDTISLFRRSNQRLLAAAVKTNHKSMETQAGFSRPNSWVVF